MEEYRFAGYRVIEFPSASKTALQEIAQRLIPYEQEIVQKWISIQFAAWMPPEINREELTEMLGGLVRLIFDGMNSNRLEDCIKDLERVGDSLARRNFPYEALVISLHFLEESYMPFLLNPRSNNTQEWLIRMDEFLHVGIAALATSYFQYYRDQLLADAEVGRIVQEALFPHLPNNIGDLELGFIYASASERTRLGGDFLDVFKYGNGGAAFVVGDLSGHGLEAATESAMIRNLFKGFTHDMKSLPSAMVKLNRVLSEDLTDKQFATAISGIYEPSGLLTLVNAGCPPPVVKKGHCYGLQHFGLPLGVEPTYAYEQTQLMMEPGNVFVAYTDGLSEARTDCDLFEEERIIQAVDQMHDAPAKCIAEHLKDEALRHANGKLLDDMAILVLKRL